MSEPEKVTVTKWRADDGSLHDSPDMARSRNQYNIKTEYDELMDEVITGSTLAQSIDFDSRQDIRDFIFESWQDINRIVQARTTAMRLSRSLT